MVGIVVVSHSRGLAHGIVDLARQMGGEDVAIVPAGGLGEDPSALGTDATLVMEAIKQADSPDGVLVLMDLGSALLSAEMAIELLGDDHEGPVMLCEAPVVEGAVSAATAAKLGRSLEEVADEARGGALAKAEHLGVSVGPPGETAIAAAEQESRLLVGNRLGLHARPAARFVQTAGRFDAEVDVTNLTTGRGPKSARSLNAVATLGVRQGHEILVRASGREARGAIQALQELAQANFGDPPEDQVPPAEELPAASVAAAAAGSLAGLPASSGVAIGPARRWVRPKPAIADRAPEAPDVEWSALEAAILGAGADIEAARSAALLHAGEEAGAIFDAHFLFLSDEALVEPARRAIFEHGLTAERAWDDAVSAVARAYRELDDDYQRARQADVLEVGNAVLEHLVGSGVSPAIEPGVLVVSELGAGDAARLDPGVTVAIAAAHGGPTSHAAILARGFGIPAVVGLGEGILELEEGTLVIVDGDAGAFVVEPPDEIIAEHQARIDRIKKERATALAEATRPALTRDGYRVEVAANAGSTEDSVAIAASGADGIGLLRTEFLFMARTEAPTEDEQYKAYSQIASALGGAPLIVRTLDAGADKPVQYLDQVPEANPFLGVRGIRLALAHPEVFATQMRAILRAAAEHPLKLMFPMISSLGELHAALELLRKQSADLESEGVPVPTDLDVGIMVEVPAAALLAARLAPNVDFFSIGTNDLSQYTMAADRGNARVAGLADALDPAVLRLIQGVVVAADALGKWVGICGEVAGDPVATPVLVGLGVRELSMAPPAVAVVKQVIRRLELESARKVAKEALSLDSAQAVRALLAEKKGRGEP